MTSIDQETGEVVATSGRSARFNLWGAFLVFSTITLMSAVETKNQEGNDDSNARWTIACASISFAISLVVTALHLHSVYSSLIIDTRLEGALILMLATFWAATVSVVSDANGGLVTDDGDDNTTIVNANLYYFTWAGFVTVILLLVGYLRAVFGVDLAGEIQNRSSRLTMWGGMLACALVVMGSSANILQRDCSGEDPESDLFCRRTLFGVAVGAISTIFSLGVVGMKMATTTAPFVLEIIFAILLIFLNAFGVAFITSPKGPGTAIGNLYYFSWLSFLCSVALVASCYDDYKNAGANNSTGHGNESTDDVDVETLPQEAAV
eukprot:CAMPEP_0198121488 /NCGR_PEP_ID=MMETSP1442-20131203/32297_1 /TAXON_ID= /ORGANISM="Craspedostauros australis, Strain CCMP3328" /LENGTH=321 /DNA_ID=CAMNT_0043780305 /DNA_START=211 /DNA_END=1176 /DNA_ORIENTATION=+